MENPVEQSERFFVKDGLLMVRESFQPHWLQGKQTIYEVVRVNSGIPLFIEDHISRFEESCNLMGYQINTCKVLKDIELCITNSRTTEKNLKFSAVFNELASVPPIFLSYFIPTKYPSQSDYKKGVTIELIYACRPSPNAKVENKSLRQQANEIIESKGVYEVLLVNEKGEITEGSRSNFFAVKNNQVFTAPSSDVLNGITRKKVVEICENQAIQCSEIPIHIEQLTSFEAAFLTGTSPKVLPIRQIGPHFLKTNHPLVLLIGALYDSKIEEYIYLTKNK